jgi:hypothetical protein
MQLLFLRNSIVLWNRIGALCVFLLLSFFPARILYTSYVPGGFFTRLIHFDSERPVRLLPEVQKLPAECKTPNSYDGQFYAQIGLVLSLDKEILDQVIDNPAYRARRIGMPALANLLSFGRPDWVLPAYSILPAIFWFAFLFYLLTRSALQTWKGYAVIFSIMLSSGTLISLDRALPDFPALVLGFLAVDFISISFLSIALLSIAILFKETSVFHLLILLPIKNIWTTRESANAAFKIGIALMPMILWFLYIYFQLDSGISAGRNNFSVPGEALFIYLRKDIAKIFTVSNWQTWEAGLNSLALISITIQALYFLFKIKISNAYWRFGIGFALLWFVLGIAVLEDIHAFSRVILPLTVAFNFLLLYKSQSLISFLIWWIAGNIGLMGFGAKILEDYF